MPTIGVSGDLDNTLGSRAITSDFVMRLTFLRMVTENVASISCGWDWSDVGLLVFALVVSGAMIGHAQDNSTEVQTHLQRAHNAITAHDLQGASNQYAEILKLDPQNVEAYTGMGVTLYGLGKPKEAVAALQSALQLDASQTTAQMFLGLSRAALGQCVAAIPLLKKYFNESTEPKLRRLEGLNLVTCYEDRSELEHAREAAQVLNRSYPDDPEVLFHLAEIYSSMLNTTVDDLLKKHSDSYRFHQIAGETLEAEGNYKQAVKEYRKALDINPRALRLHYRIGRLILLTAGRTEADGQALVEFQKELSINPQDAASEYRIGEIFLTDHRNEEARQSFLRALELSPDFAEAHIGLAKIELEDHQPERALTELERAIQLQPKNPSAHYTLMLACRDLGKRQQAIHEMEVFQNLKAEENKDFRSELRALLAGGESEPEKSR